MATATARKRRRDSLRKRQFERRLKFVEHLEDRRLLTVYIDFGTTFPEGVLDLTVGDYSEIHGANLIGYGGDKPKEHDDNDMVSSTTLSFNESEITWDYNGDGSIGDRQDATDFQDDVFQRVVDRFALTMETITLADISATTHAGYLTAIKDLMDGDDTYVFVCDQSRTDYGETPVPLGEHCDFGGIAPGHDSSNSAGPGVNDEDETVMICGELWIGNRPGVDKVVADVIAHEVAHAAGLSHVFDTMRGVNNPVQAFSDVMSYSSDPTQTNLFTRYPLEVDFTNGGNYDPVTQTYSPAPTDLFSINYEHITDASSFGEAALMPAYVTGTGADDVITITYVAPGWARVEVTAYENGLPLPVPQSTTPANNWFMAGYTISGAQNETLSYLISTFHGIDVFAGRGSDEINIDAATVSDVTGPLTFDTGPGLAERVKITGTDGADTLYFSDRINVDEPGILSIDTGEGSDYIHVAWVSDTIGNFTINAGGGNDTIQIDSGNNMTRNLHVNGNEGDDDIFIPGITAGTHLMINGGDDNDEFFVGGGDYMLNIDEVVSIDGGPGSDSLNIEDSGAFVPLGAQEVYTIGGQTFDKSESGVSIFPPYSPYETHAPRLTFYSIDAVTLNASNGGTSWTDGNSAIHVNCVIVSTDLTVNTNTGFDDVIVGDGDYLSNIQGDLTVIGGDATDLIFDDRGTIMGDKRVDVYRMTGTDFTKSQFDFAAPAPWPTHAGTTRFSSIQSLTLEGSGGIADPDPGLVYYNSVIKIREVLVGTPLTVNGHSGNDEFVICGGDLFSGDYDTNIKGELTLDGGGDYDRVMVDDTNDIGDDHYLFSLATVGGDPGGQFTKDSGMGDEGVLDYVRVEEFVVEGSNSNNTFDIQGTPVGTQLIAYGNSGSDVFDVIGGGLLTLDGGNQDDTFNIGSNKGPLEDFGHITVYGGSGVNTMNLEDTYMPPSIAAMPDPWEVYRIEDDFFTKPAPRGEPNKFFLHYHDLDAVLLQANRLDNLIHVQSTAPGTAVTLEGNDGDDEFHVDATGLHSTVMVHGGDPTSPPGDSLHITGTPESSGVYTPDTYNESRGDVEIGDHNVRFSGLEPIVVENFGSFALVTPRSRDIITVAPADPGWTTIGGFSGGDGHLQKFESLTFRDVREVTLDAASRDLVPYQHPPVDGPWHAPAPDDQITVAPNALRARGLEFLRVKTGDGANVVFDQTLLSTSPATAELRINGNYTDAGTTTHYVYGTPNGLEIDQISGFRITALIDAQQVLGRFSYQDVDHVIMLGQQRDVRLSTRDVGSLALDTDGSRQRLVADGFMIDMGVDADGKLSWFASGESGLELGEFLFPELDIVGDAARSDSLTISPRAAGPQPEPPDSPEFRMRGFHSNDSVILESLADEGTPLPTSFRAIIQPLDITDPLAIIQPLEIAVELLVITTGETWGVHVGNQGTGEFPEIVLKGTQATGVSHDATLRLPSGQLDPVAVELLVRTAGITQVAWQGGEISEQWRLSPIASGGVQVESQDPSLGEAGPSVRTVTDQVAQRLSLNGADRLLVEYPEPDFRTLEANVTGVPKMAHDAGNGSIQHDWTPTLGVASSGNWTVRHDGATTEAMLTGAATTSILSGRFTDPIRLDHILTGSTSIIVSEDAHFERGIVTTIQGEDGADNKIIHTEINTVHATPSQTVIHGGSGGSDYVLITGAGVDNLAGKSLLLDLKDGENTVVFAETNIGQAAAAVDNATITAGVGSTNTLVYSAQDDASPADQLIQLRSERPELEAAITVLEAAAGPIQDELEVGGWPQSATPDVEKNIVVDAYEANVDLIATNATDRLTRILLETSGQTNFDIEGNVLIESQAFYGTGITPTGTFHTCPVTTSADSGPGSLRAAIDCANAVPGDDWVIVTFAIPTTDGGFLNVDAAMPGGDTDPDAFVLSPLTALPAITRGSVLINGQTQQLATGDTNPFGPEIVLDGSQVNSSGDALQLRSDGNHIHALNIRGFAGSGVVIWGDENRVTGSFIGTDATGSQDLGNLGFGVFVIEASNNTIEDNLVSGNDVNGVVIGGLTATGNMVRNNRIGTDRNGTMAIGNTLGVHVADAPGNFIEANLISGNLVGVDISGAGATGNVVRDNWIGTDSDGKGALGNRADGVFVDHASGNTFLSNVIAASGLNGVFIDGGSANVLQGNYIGVDATGSVAMGNGGHGIYLIESPGTIIGGTSEAERNVIANSGSAGIAMRIASHDVRIQGNYIGTDVTGTVAMGNPGGGISVEGSANVTIGGTIPGAGNVIADNAFGIGVRGDSPEIVIQGNLIGTDATGTQALGNGGGITIGDPHDAVLPSRALIGGTTEGARNLIANNANGITLARSDGNTIQGNFIGTDITGTQNMGNPGRSIWLKNSADNLIGGSLPGSGNLIAGDASIRGLIAIEYEESTGNKIQGNYVGVDAGGSYALGNAITGIRVDWGAGDTLIGTDGDGVGDEFEGNLVAGIGGSSGSLAIRLNGDDNVVTGNLIGTNSSGTVAIPNYRGVGVWGSNNRIGTNGDGVSDQLERNIVDSIEVNGSILEDGARYNVIAGNYIGTDITGTERLGNGGSAFSILFNYAHNNRIGTDADGVSDVLERNVMGSSNHTVHIGNSTGNVVAGNFVGVGADGRTPISEAAVGGDGILMGPGAFANTIGGATEVERNVISGNEWRGVAILGTGSDENVVQGNYIGVDAFGDPLGNGMHGVVIGGGASRNAIGGTQPGEGNFIANNNWTGVVIDDEDTQGNSIRGNKIYANGGLGVDLGADGVTLNDLGDADAGPNALQDFPMLAFAHAGSSSTRLAGTLNSVADTTFDLDFFANAKIDPSGYGEGQRYLGSTTITTDATGNASFDAILPASTVDTEWITATATNIVTGDTSEFSVAYLADDLPGTFIVTNTNSDGPGSLREAIVAANAFAGNAMIEFRIPDTDSGFTDVDSAMIGGDPAPDVFVIQPKSPLPSMANANFGITIDGASQLTWGGDTNPFGPEIVLSGSAIPVSTNGLHLASDGNHVRGLNIQHFHGYMQSGILIEGEGNVITGCYIGSDATGSEVAANPYGITIRDGGGNLIGGTTSEAGNLISGNALGIYITGDSSKDNQIQGNTIGPDIGGTIALTLGRNTFTNLDGIIIDGGLNNRIGGDEPGASNVISGHWEQAIWIRGTAASTRIEGNLLGTDASGTALLSDESLRQGNIRGVLVQDSPGNEIIDNVLSGNYTGIEITGDRSTDHVIQGNRIGTDATGSVVLGNAGYGIDIQDAANTVIGGVEDGEGNVISGNARFGIHLRATEGGLILGNVVGTDIDSKLDLGNDKGIKLVDASRVTIGGTEPGAGNVISGNVNGIVIDGPDATDNRVQGNIIGADVTGLVALPNEGGVSLGYGAHHNFIGTDGDGIDDDLEGNLISGNAAYGVHFWLVGTEHNIVAGNLIGVDATGLTPMPNATGVQITLGAAWNLIGTNADGVSDDLERNVISGNTGSGVSITADPWTPGGADYNTVAGNRIGTDFDGLIPIGNGRYGIHIAWSQGAVGAPDPQPPTANMIGGANPAERNIISANQLGGIYAYPAVGTTIAGNYIGVDATGSVAMGNGGHGIYLIESPGTIIGGTSEAERNVIANSGSAGIAMRIASHDVRIQGNYIGTDVTGTVAMGNPGGGISVEGSAHVTIGGTIPGAGNVIADNAFGIGVRGDSSEIVIQGNLIGTDATGTQALGNGGGITIGHPHDAVLPSGALIGGTTEGARNVIANNTNGITLERSDGNTIQGNYIGTDITGTQNMGNPGRSIWLKNSADNLIGGSLPGSGNLIAGDASIRGLIEIEYEESTGNKIQGNYVGVDVTGAHELGTCIVAIRVGGGAGHTVIGTDGDGVGDQFEGNLVAGIGGSSGSKAIFLSGDHNVVAGNRIGVDATGTVAIPNYWGVGVFGSHNRVGTNGDGVSDQLERNVVDSIEVNGSYLEDGAQHNVIAGNYIGTDISGNQRLGVGALVMFRGNANNNRLGTNADGVSDELERNVIAGRTDNTNGVLHLESSTGNRVAGNYIGVGADGTTPFEGSATGILVRLGSTFQTIGGTTEAERNVIGNVNWSGIHIGGEDCHHIVVQGNHIGVDAFGNPAGNGQHGVVVGGGASHNVIGGAQPGEGNVIAHNHWAAVVVDGEDTQGNTIRGNSIYANGGLGIDLGRDGITANDPRDLDSGANDLQNFPAISLAANGTTTRVAGVLHSTPLKTFTIDFYANTEVDPSGHGEGQRWLGSGLVATDEHGNGSYDVVLNGATNNKEWITATATDANGSTSEFSQPVDVEDVPANTLVVTNTNDSGVGSLRQAILDANQVGGTDPAHIWFRLQTTDPGFVDIDAHLLEGDTLPDVFLFTPLTALPALTRDNVTIDGESEFAVMGGGKNPWGPMIVLNGSAIASPANGLRLDSNENRVHGLTIQEFSGNGIFVTGDGNVFTGNYIGTDAMGTSAAGNVGTGIRLNGASNSVIGGTKETLRNVISGNDGYGIWVRAASSDTSIQGNFLGTDATGTLPVGNHSSNIYVEDAAGTIIGGSDPGAGNVISASRAHHGIYLREDTTDTVIQQNLIGTDVTGTRELGNTYYGILVGYGYDATFPTRTLIGGTDPLAGNLISNSGQHGILIARGGGNTIQGNMIGTVVSGTKSMGNGVRGIFLSDSSDNLIGGNVPGSRNVISGNTNAGVAIEGSLSTGNKIQGNYIGVDASGSVILANGASGVSILDGASGNFVGADGDGIGDADEGNVISGHEGPYIAGVHLASDDNVVAGNLIGTDVSGKIAIGNQYGVWITGGTGNVIGGAVQEQRNIISGNLHTGVVVDAATDNTIIGNYIGTDVTGMTILGNHTDGVAINGHHAGAGNRIGGNTAGERNVISGNQRFGIMLNTTKGTLIQGNYVGTNAAGDASIGYVTAGIALVSDDNSVIGGAEPGAGNVISGNGPYGIWMYGGNGTENVLVQGNKIGTTADGTAALPNWRGMQINGAGGANTIYDVVIGGAEPGAGNVVSGNQYMGIHVLGSRVSNVRIQGNHIGTGADGMTAIPNGQEGILIDHDAGGVIIGGTDPGAGNVISGNAGDAISIYGNAPATKSESFDLSHVTRLHGWSEFGNREHRNAFGFSQTNHTDLPDSPGHEAGGTFARSSTALGEMVTTPIAYYADTQLGAQFSLDDPLRAAGELIVTETDAFDGGVWISYFDRSTAQANRRGSALGLVVLEPNANEGVSGLRVKAGMALSNGTVLYGRSENGTAINAPDGLDEGVVYTWSYDYDPRGGANGAGRLIVEAFADGISMGTNWLDLTAAQRDMDARFDAFGLYTGGDTPKPNNPNTVALYVDNLVYDRVTGNTIQGNFIGTSAGGALALGNGGAGVSLLDSAANTIGGEIASAGNVISANGSSGVVIHGVAATGNTIRGNAIYANGGLGIDLGGDGVTLNDGEDKQAEPPKLPDEDAGANQLQNFPHLLAVATGKTTQVSGTLESTPETAFVLDFYANDVLDPSGHGEGQRWLGSSESPVVTNKKGFVQFRVSLDELAEAGQFVTATATDPEGNTSEFSAGFMVTGIKRPSNTMIVGGSGQDDVILLEQGSTIVTVNGQLLGHFETEGMEIQVFGLGGNDTIVSHLQQDTSVSGGDGDDQIWTGAGNDHIDGGGGDDEIHAGAGDDRIDGGSGNDSIDGQEGSDNVVTGDGNDTVITDADDDLGAFSLDVLSPCSLNEESVAVRGQPLIVSASFSDPGSTVAWDFGDGGIADGPETTHTYASEGDYTVEVTIADAEGNETKLVRGMPITQTAMQVDPKDPALTALAVGGTTGDDRILITKHGNQDEVKVLLDGDSLGIFAPTGHLLVYGQAGDDNIQVAGSVSVASWLFGDAGDDRLMGGGGPDVLSGGPGDDMLIGGSGGDMLVGGPGADRLVGNAGEDILIGGLIWFQHVEAAWAAIMSEWTSDRTYDERVANLRGHGSSSSFAHRANGEVYLTVDGPTATVRDDGERDVLTGSAGRDWFFADLAEDQLTDLKLDDVLSELGASPLTDAPGRGARPEG